MNNNERFIKKLQDTMKGVLLEVLGENKRFTGKIVFTIDCKDGGIGSIGTYVQKKIKNYKSIDILKIF